MSEIKPDVIAAIGNTPLIRLRGASQRDKKRLL
jgi:hypothetical protein